MSYRLAIALGADAVEPDLVMTADGVAVLRYETEIGGTTDVALHPEFADHPDTTRMVRDEWAAERLSSRRSPDGAGAPPARPVRLTHRPSRSAWPRSAAGR
jgi:glycerophosphoryl diester phosphodiesterase